MKKGFLLKNKDGFTLVEVLLYIAIVAGVLLTLISFTILLFSNRQKIQTIAEVEQQAVQIIERFKETVRNTDSIVSPSKGASASQLTVDDGGVGNQRTVFREQFNVFQVSEGGGGYQDLSNSKVEITNLTFENVGSAGGYGSIKISFTLSYINNSGGQNFTYSKDFYASATVR